MANDIESNFREKVLPTFVKHADNARVFSKNVNTQLLDGVFDANSGDSVAFKRNSDYVAIETADGDLTSDSLLLSWLVMRLDVFKTTSLYSLSTSKSSRL